ncbi:MAG: F0F1 ATP synthase subunit gamma [Vulcanimicrobiota bacterium]
MDQTLAGLRHQLDSAADLASVVGTMKALAASSVGQYSNAVQALEDYFRTVELALIAWLLETSAWPSLKGRPSVAGTCAIVFGSDQGLVGRFNLSLTEFVVEELPRPIGDKDVWAVGERVAGSLIDAGLQVVGVLPVPNSVSAITTLVEEIEVRSDARRSLGDYGEVQVFHNRMTGAQSYQPVGQRLLPLDEGWRQDLLQTKWPTQSPPQMIDNGTWAMPDLVREYLFVSLFRASAESLMSENTSRLAAMQRAEENIEERVGTLTRSYHRLRQNQIDEELFDVISGYEAQTTSEI